MLSISSQPASYQKSFLLHSKSFLQLKFYCRLLVYFFDCNFYHRHWESLGIRICWNFNHLSDLSSVSLLFEFVETANHLSDLISALFLFELVKRRSCLRDLFYWEFIRICWNLKLSSWSRLSWYLFEFTQTASHRCDLFYCYFYSLLMNNSISKLVDSSQRTLN